MKIRNGLLFVLLLFIPFILFGCESKITLTIDPSHYDMAVGDELNINPIIKNLNGDNLVEYNIEKPEIISITNNKIKALSNGSTSVQAKVIGHDDVTTTFTVSVTLLEISGVQPLNFDETIKLELKVNGNITTDVVWKVSDENIASIDNQGQLKGKNVGTVTVSAQYQNLSKVININVVDVDKVAPTISIDSSLITNDVIINYNDDFDPLLGIKANDDRDGDITSKIVIDGEVNNHVMGEYVLTYTVADEAGNVSLPLVRKITVIWDYNVTFIGHAGCYSGLMNTEDAFINAASVHGYQAIECDVKQTKDGVFVTCHDDSFAGKDLAKTNWNDLKDLEITQTRGGIPYTSKICTFKRYLEICKEYNVKAVVELKSSAGITNTDQSRMKALMQEIEEVGMVDNVIFLGSQYNCLIWTRKNGYSNIPCQYLVNSIESVSCLERCIDNNLDVSFNIAYSNSQEWIDRYQELGIKVACYTFSQYQTKEDLQKWLDMGVDYVTCDDLRPYQVNLPVYQDDSSLPTYSVKFEDWDGNLIKECHVKEGKRAVSPLDPVRPGYEFTGWNDIYTSITENKTIKAQYKIIEYSITYIANNDILTETSWKDKNEFVTELYTDWYNWMDTMVGKISGFSKSGNTYTFTKNGRTSKWSNVEEMKKINIYDFEVTLSNVAYKPVDRETKYQTVEPEVDDNYFLNTEPYRTKYRGMDAYLLHAVEAAYSGYATSWKPTSAGKIQIWFRFHQWQQGTPISAFDTLPKKYVKVENVNIKVTLPTTPISYTVEDEITLPVPTVTGATFGGWYDNIMCNGTEIKNISKGTTGNLILFAKWIVE